MNNIEIEDLLLDKKAFRQKQLKKLQQHADQTAIESGVLLERLLASEVWQKAKTVGVTMSSPIEVNTKPIIKAALMFDKKIYLPKTMPNRQMAFLPYTGKENLEKSSFGVLEPEYNALLVASSLDLMIVPGIAFGTDTGYRVGFGGGYYDRYLKDFKGATIALVPSVMNFSETFWETGDYDIQIQNLITV